MTDEHNVTVSVDRATCIGNGICVAMAPRAFRLDAAMKAQVLDARAESYDALLAAAEACPVQAIYLSADGEPIYP